MPPGKLMFLPWVLSLINKKWRMDSGGILRPNIFGKTQQRRHCVNLGIFKRLGVGMRKRTRPSEVGSKKASTSTIGVMGDSWKKSPKCNLFSTVKTQAQSQSCSLDPGFGPGVAARPTPVAGARLGEERWLNKKLELSPRMSCFFWPGQK